MLLNRQRPPSAGNPDYTYQTFLLADGTVSLVVDGWYPTQFERTVDTTRFAMMAWAPLVPEDTNGSWDLYAWDDGILSRVSKPVAAWTGHRTSRPCTAATACWSTRTHGWIPRTPTSATTSTPGTALEATLLSAVDGGADILVTAFTADGASAIVTTSGALAAGDSDQPRTMPIATRSTAPGRPSSWSRERLRELGRVRRWCDQ